MSAAPPIIPVGAELPAMDREPSRRVRSPASTPKGKRPVGERFRSINSFADFTLRTLTRNEIAVWLVLWRDSREGVARAGQGDIAKRAGISTRTVRRAIRRLVGRGLLVVVHRGRIGKGPSAYRVRPLAREE